MKNVLRKTLKIIGIALLVLIAAAFLIVKEAGGIIYSPLDEVLDSELGVDSRMSYIAFSNHNLHDIVFEALSARK